MFYASPDFDAALKLGTTYLSYGLRLQREDGALGAWTRLRRDVALPLFQIPIAQGGRYARTLSVPATLFRAGAGLGVTNLMLSDSPSQVDNMEVSLNYGAGLLESEVRLGLWENAKCWLLLFDWKTPVGSDGAPRAMLRLRGELGERTLNGRAVTWKLRSLVHRLRGDVLESTGRDNRARWGDPELAFFDLDGQTADGKPARLQAQVSEIDPQFPARRFKVTPYPFLDDRLENGLARFGSGANAGQELGVLDVDTGTGWLIVRGETRAPLQIGDVVRLQMRPPRLFSEWLLWFGTGRGFAAEPLIPTFESSNRVTR